MEARHLGFQGAVAMLLAVGIGLLVLTGLFYTIIATSDDPGEGLVDTTIWFTWIAGTLVSLALIGAGYIGKDVPLGARAAFVLVGVYLLLQVSSSGSALLGIMGNMFRGF